MTPPAVAIVTAFYPPVLGGAETAAAQLAEFLSQQGRQVTVITKRTDRAHAAEETVNGVRIVRVGPIGERTAAAKWMASPKILVELSRRRADYDVVICIDYRAVGLAALVARGLTNRPVIFQAATEGVIAVSRVRDAFGADASEVQRRVADAAVWPIQRLYDGADAYACISRAIEQEVLSAGVPRERVHYLPNPVDTKMFSPVSAEDRLTLRRARGISETSRVAVVAGRLSREKGQLDLLRAWKLVTLPDTLLIVVGPDMPGHPWNTGPEARAFVEREGLSERVRFVGGVLQSEVADWFRVADVAVHPSHFEAFGTAAIEAMAAGVPVIASDTGGLRDFVESGINGFRVPPQQPEALADILTRVLDDRALRVELAASALRTAQRFDVHRVLGEFARLIDQLAARNG